MTNDTTHTCPRCGVTKSLSEFAGRKNKNGLPFPASYCRECQATYNRQWRAANGAAQLAKRKAKYKADPEFRARMKETSARRWAENPGPQRNSYLLLRFGISLEEYNRMDVIQCGLCAICKEPCNSGRSLAVDHDHSTGTVRGLLCLRCNNGLGHFRDRLDLLSAASDYLKEPTMTTYYVSDHESLVGKPADADAIEVKVITAPAPTPVKSSKVAEVK